MKKAVPIILEVMLRKFDSNLIFCLGDGENCIVDDEEELNSRLKQKEVGNLRFINFPNAEKADSFPPEKLKQLAKNYKEYLKKEKSYDIY